MKKYQITGLSCAHCAQKLEQAVNKREEVNSFELNYAAQKLKVDSNDLPSTIKFIENYEEGITLVDLEQKKQHNHGHSHDHEHDDLNVAILKVVISTLLFIISFFVDGQLQIIIRMIAYIIVSYSVIIKAVKNLLRGNLFDEFFLMSLATIAAISIGELVEAIAVMLFYSIGEIFQEKALNNSRKSIQDLLELKVENVRVLINEKEQILQPEAVEIGSVVEVLVGEKIPIDGVLLSEDALLNTAALTGEAVPREYEKEQQLLAGMIVEDKPLLMQTTAEFSDSAISKMLEMVESASSRKTKTERFISEFSRIYTPAVILLAVLLVIFLPMFGIPYDEVIYRVVILLVISCPCALVLSVPLGYFAGIGRAAKSGILIKGANYLDQLAKIDTIMLDKTGTITHGNFVVTNVDLFTDANQEQINQAIYLGESKSNHPIAKSVSARYAKYKTEQELIDYTEIKGCGIEFKLNGKDYLIGNQKLLNKYGVKFTKTNSESSIVYVAENNIHVQTIEINDELKQDSKEAIEKFKNIGINNVIMLTGDQQKTAAAVASTVGIDKYFAELLPEDKVEHVAKELESGKEVGFIGDGINDAPVIARANVGIAMGALGSDIAIETADVVINNDSLMSLFDGIEISRFSRKIIKQNIAFALIVKFTIITLGVFGDATMWEAVFSDVGVTLIAILNSIRIMKK